MLSQVQVQVLKSAMTLVKVTRRQQLGLKREMEAKGDEEVPVEKKKGKGRGRGRGRKVQANVEVEAPKPEDEPEALHDASVGGKGSLPEPMPEASKPKKPRKPKQKKGQEPQDANANESSAHGHLLEKTDASEPQAMEAVEGEPLHPEAAPSAAVAPGEGEQVEERKRRRPTKKVEEKSSPNTKLPKQVRKKAEPQQPQRKGEEEIKQGDGGAKLSGNGQAEPEAEAEEPAEPLRSFARRVRPKSKEDAIARWDSIRQAFNDFIRTHTPSASSHEAGFL